MKGIVNDVTANFRQRCYFSYTDLYMLQLEFDSNLRRYNLRLW